MGKATILDGEIFYDDKYIVRPVIALYMKKPIFAKNKTNE
jgi:hypothetical protein